MVWKTFALSAILIAFLAVPAASKMYEWVDENGVKHYTNDPPPKDVKAEQTFKEKESSVPPAPRVTVPPVQLPAPAATPAKAAAPSENEIRLRNQRSRLADSYEKLASEKVEIMKDGRRLRFDKNRYEGLNRKIAAYEKDRQAFNRDPLRIKLDMAELPDLDPVPYQNRGKSVNIRDASGTSETREEASEGGYRTKNIREASEKGRHTESLQESSSGGKHTETLEEASGGGRHTETIEEAGKK